MTPETLQQFVKLINPQKEFSDICMALLSGENKVAHNTIDEAITLDDGWIAMVENSLYSIEQIVKTPKKFIKDEEYVVDVEKAKKTNARTVQHLASHTKNIASISASGDVRPKRVLTVEMEEDLGIYENRFVSALIDRLLIFVERRFNDINDKMKVRDVTKVDMESNFDYGLTKFEYKMQLRVSEPPINTALVKKNEGLLERIEVIRKRIRILINSDFHRKLSQQKPIYPPINKTNIISMNVDYNVCYKLWLYISSYTFVGYSVELKNKNLPIDTDFYDDLTILAGLSVKALLTNNKLNSELYENISFVQAKSKKYKVVTDFKYEPNFKQSNEKVSDDAVNEYYFKKMKEALSRAVNTPSSTAIVEEKELDLSFSKFYRALNKINNQMYDDLIKRQSKQNSEKNEEKSPVKQKELAWKEQQKIYRKYKALSKLKAEELEKSLKEESRQMLKLDKLKTDFDKAQKKAIDKKEKARLQKIKLQEIKRKAKQAVESADVYEGELYDREQERLALLAEKRRIRNEQARERRERKKLEELKNKYEE